jgi:TolB-like protein
MLLPEQPPRLSNDTEALTRNFLVLRNKLLIRAQPGEFSTELKEVCMSDKNTVSQSTDGEADAGNVLKEAGLADDDLLEQAKDTGKALLSFGRKCFLITRVGLSKLKEKTFMKQNKFAFIFFFGILSVYPIYAQSVSGGPVLYSGTGGKDIVISVSLPVMQNKSAANNWVPSFFQDIITGDIARFSAMTVIDSHNETAVLAEQQKTESGLFAETDLNVFGNLTTPGYVVTGTITSSGSQYNLTFRVNELATNEIKASYNGRCSMQEIEKGISAKTVVRELLTGMGVTLTAEGERQLLGPEEKRIQAQVQVARGTAASQSGNDVSALALYAEAMDIDPAYTIAREKFEGFSVTSSVRERANAAIILTERWNKIFKDLRFYINANPATVEIDWSKIEETKINTSAKTLDLKVSPGIRFIPNRETFMVYQTIMLEFEKVAASEENKTWIRNVKKLSNPIEIYIFANVGLYNEFNDCIAQKQGSFVRIQYFWYGQRGALLERGFLVSSDGESFSRYYTVQNGMPSYNKLRNDIKLRTITFQGVPMYDITDIMTPKIEWLRIENDPGVSRPDASKTISLPIVNIQNNF